MARKHRFASVAYDQINVTPLIDTLFFLLIIFMITAPLLEYSIDVSPPAMTATKIKPDDNTKTINLTKNGEILFEKKPVAESDLTKQLAALKSAYPNRKFSILLRADGSQKYEKVISVMKAVKKANFKDISLVTSEE